MFLCGVRKNICTTPFFDAQELHSSSTLKVNGIMAFFNPFNYLSHFVNFTLKLSLFYSPNSNKKLQKKRKEVSAFHFTSKEVKKSHLQKQLNFQRHILYKQPRLTKWWNSEIFVQIFYSYFRYTGRYFLGCVLFDACCNVTRAT